MKFSDVHAAARLRDFVRDVARKEIDQVHPADIFGVVSDIDEIAGTVKYVASGSTAAESSASYGFGESPSIGSRVRIVGRSGARYVVPPGSSTSLPPGGDINDVLTKQSGDDYDVIWAPGASATATSGLTWAKQAYGALNQPGGQPQTAYYDTYGGFFGKDATDPQTDLVGTWSFDLYGDGNSASNAFALTIDPQIDYGYLDQGLFGDHLGTSDELVFYRDWELYPTPLTNSQAYEYLSASIADTYATMQYHLAIQGDEADDHSIGINLQLKSLFNPLTNGAQLHLAGLSTQLEPYLFALSQDNNYVDFGFYDPSVGGGLVTVRADNGDMQWWNPDDPTIASVGGPVLMDRTTATLYRLYVNAGVLTLEAV